MKTRTRWLMMIAGGVVVVLLFIPSCYYVRARSYPAYWSPKTPDAQMAQRADALERRVASDVTRVREDDPTWTLELTADQMNEWLASRLPRWLANRGAAGDVGGAMVVLGAGQLELAVEAMFEGSPWLVRFVCEPIAPPDNAGDEEPARLRVREIYVGKLAVSFDTVVSLAGGQLDAEGRQALNDLATGLPMVMDLGDGRIVRVQNATIDPERMVMRCRTVFVGKSR